MKNVILSRRELYDLIWSTPMTTLAKQYSISDTGLRKVCLRMDIPLPNAGHWEKVRAGRKILAKKLSENYSGVMEVTLSLLDDSEQQKRIAATVEKKLLLNEFENDPTFRVPEKLTNPDKWIVNAKVSLTAKRQYGFHNGLANTNRDELDIRVSPDNIDRALRFMDTFIKIMRNRGHRFVIENERPRIVINDEKASFILKETCKRIMIKERWERTELVPTGILKFTTTFHFRSEAIWKDGRLPLEIQLQNIIPKLELKAREESEYHKQLKKQWAVQREQERIRKEFEERKSKELSDFRSLFIKAQRWREAEGLRNYLAEYEERAKQKGTLTEDKIIWLEWARKKADWYDPEVEAEDEFLKGINRDEVNKQKSESSIYNRFAY